MFLFSFYLKVLCKPMTLHQKVIATYVHLMSFTGCQIFNYSFQIKLYILKSSGKCVLKYHISSFINDVFPCKTVGVFRRQTDYVFCQKVLAIFLEALLSEMTE